MIEMINNLYKWFQENNYFTINSFTLKYLKLLSSYSITNDDYLTYNKHHCIPVCYYKQIYGCKNRREAEKFADTDNNNIILNVPQDIHLLLHFYLCKFCTSKLLTKRLISAFLQLMNFSHTWASFNKMNDHELLLEAQKHFKDLNKDYYGKSVICIELNKTFTNICLANEFINKNRYSYCGIYNTCLHRDNQQTAGGYHWCYADNIEEYQQLSVKYYNKQPKTHIKKIYCFELSKIFISAAEAARALSSILNKQISRALITSCCTKQIAATHGYHFCYLEEKETYKILPYNNKLKTAAQKKAISIGTKAAMQKIPKDIRQKQIEKSKAYWKDKKHYYNNGIEEVRASICPDGWRVGRLEKYKTKGKKIKCIELNKIYNSCIEAGKELLIDSNSINNCIHKRSKTAGGYHWEAV